LVEEFNQPQNGQMLRRDHSSFLMPALGQPLAQDQLRAAASIGYGKADFTSQLFAKEAGRTLVFLSFWADADIPVYRHKQSDLSLPYWLVGAQSHDLTTKDELRSAVAQTDAQRQRLAVLCDEFEHEGLLSNEQMASRYTAILNHLPDDTQVVVVLAPTLGPRQFQNPDLGEHPHHKRLNAALRTVAAGRNNVMLLDPADFIHGAGDMIDLNHFKRPVYHRMYQDVLTRLSPAQTDKSQEAEYG